MMTSACLLEEAMSSKDDVSNISKQQAVFRNDDVSKELVSAMMTSACLLEEAMSSKDEQYHSRKLQIQRREVADEDRTVMMTSAVMSSQSAVEQKQFQQLTREAQEMERRRLTLHSISAVALNSRCIQLLQAFNCWGAFNAQDERING
ncbi:hypothetical protein F511_35482 [Dorcoceras hygrometricum]|uniref:Uncharacterized protein n=1 Tax=Dorcoceras hygrometricum TaxID=472368 RepID=A0A2Z7CBC2_9LAMI|nr:hypothetical protein F511_35482 [Dorcoceras hygrometricum]